jgi:quercetin dioxygenase-like cupin family protein
MAVVKCDDIRLDEIEMDGVAGVSKANVIGQPEGWNDYTLRVFRISPGGFTPHHKHDWEHVNYVIRGRGVLTIGEQSHEISEKGFAFVPSNAMHQFKNPHDEDFEFICVVPNCGA